MCTHSLHLLPPIHQFVILQQLEDLTTSSPPQNTNRHPDCDRTDEDCWFAHGEKDLRCEDFAFNGVCHKRRVGQCKLKHTVIRGDVIQYDPSAHDSDDLEERLAALNLDSSSAHLTSQGRKPTAKIPPYQRYLQFYPLPEQISEIVSTDEEAMENLPATIAKIRRETRQYVRANCSSPDRCRLDPTNTDFKCLLHAEEVQDNLDIRQYDLKDARVVFEKFDPESSDKYVLLRIDVPGLAEKRPSILRGDKIDVCDVADQTWHRGFVFFVNIDHVVVNFDRSEMFERSRRSLFHVVFSVSRITNRLMYRALEEASPLPVGSDSEFCRTCRQRCANALSEAKLPTPSLLLLSSTSSAASAKSSGLLSESCGKLNACQQAAVLAGLCDCQMVNIIWGPPGTGKTTTVAALVCELFAQARAGKTDSKPRVLIATPSNEAADHIASVLIKNKLGSNGVKILRLNAAMRKEKGLPPDVLSVSMKDHKGGFEIPDCATLETYDVVISTLVSSGQIYSLGVDPGFYSHIVVDEAGQALEPEIMIPLILEERDRTKVIIAGDPKQLGPIVRSPIAAEYGLGRSPLKRLLDDPRSKNITLLSTSYRAHKSIMSLYNTISYDGKLQAHPTNTSSFIGWPKLPNPKQPMVLDHQEGEDTQEADSPSWLNQTEAHKAVEWVEKLLQDRTRATRPNEIVILAPYLKQVQKIRGILHHKGLDDVLVSTVEGFQGKESKVIIISCVRSLSTKRPVGARGGLKGVFGGAGSSTSSSGSGVVERIEKDLRFQLGFLKQPERLNVAISRARELLVVIGNTKLLRHDPNFNKLISMMSAAGCILGLTQADLDSLLAGQGADQSRLPFCSGSLLENYKLAKLLQRRDGAGDGGDNDDGDANTDAPWRDTQ